MWFQNISAYRWFASIKSETIYLYEILDSDWFMCMFAKAWIPIIPISLFLKDISHLLSSSTFGKYSYKYWQLCTCCHRKLICLSSNGVLFGQKPVMWIIAWFEYDSRLHSSKIFCEYNIRYTRILLTWSRCFTIIDTYQLQVYQ